MTNSAAPYLDRLRGLLDEECLAFRARNAILEGAENQRQASTGIQRIFDRKAQLSSAKAIYSRDLDILEKVAVSVLKDSNRKQLELCLKTLDRLEGASDEYIEKLKKAAKFFRGEDREYIDTSLYPYLKELRQFLRPYKKRMQALRSRAAESMLGMTDEISLLETQVRKARHKLAYSKTVPKPSSMELDAFDGSVEQLISLSKTVPEVLDVISKAVVSWRRAELVAAEVFRLAKKRAKGADAHEVEAIDAFGEKYGTKAENLARRLIEVFEKSSTVLEKIRDFLIWLVQWLHRLVDPNRKAFKGKSAGHFIQAQHEKTFNAAVQKMQDFCKDKDLKWGHFYLRNEFLTWNKFSKDFGRSCFGNTVCLAKELLQQGKIVPVEELQDMESTHCFAATAQSIQLLNNVAVEWNRTLEGALEQKKTMIPLDLRFLDHFSLMGKSGKTTDIRALTYETPGIAILLAQQTHVTRHALLLAFDPECQRYILYDNNCGFYVWKDVDAFKTGIQKHLKAMKTDAFEISI